MWQLAATTRITGFNRVRCLKKRASTGEIRATSMPSLRHEKAQKAQKRLTALPVLLVLFCGNCSPASTCRCSKPKRGEHQISQSQSFSLNNFAGISGRFGPRDYSIPSWHDRCHKPGTRSIAVIGRKRSAQESWDDACASRHFRRISSTEAAARDRPNL